VKEPYSFTFFTASWYRRSPYWQRTVEAGCTSWDLYNHMLIPTLYDDHESTGTWSSMSGCGTWRSNGRSRSSDPTPRGHAAPHVPGLVVSSRRVLCLPSSSLSWRASP